MIYANEPGRAILNRVVRPMMQEIYEQLLDDLVQDRPNSPIFRHHILPLRQSDARRLTPYEAEHPDRIVADYIACMTDDYFVDLHAHLFPNSPHRIEYVGYFV